MTTRTTRRFEAPPTAIIFMMSFLMLLFGAVGLDAYMQSRREIYDFDYTNLSDIMKACPPMRDDVRAVLAGGPVTEWRYHRLMSKHDRFYGDYVKAQARNDARASAGAPPLPLPPACTV